MSVSTAPRRAVVQLLRDSFRGHRIEVVKLLIWSAFEAGAAYASGRLVELAVDDGFLAHRPVVGFEWLGLLAAAFIAGGIASGQVLRRLGAVVEPMRDDLAQRVVEGSIRLSARSGARVDRAGVARLTEQVEIAREAIASLLMVTQGFIVAIIGAAAGLASLIPSALVLVLPPVLLGLGVFLTALPRIARGQLASIMADERAADRAAAVAAGMRDIVAAGAESSAEVMIGREIEAQAEATRQLARLKAVRTMAVATGGLLPVVLILVFGPWLRSNGATTGIVLGALTYVLTGVQPALQGLVRNLATNGAWLASSLGRILEAVSEVEDLPEHAAEGSWRPGRSAVEIRGLTFAYSATAKPVIRDLDLTIAHGGHLAIIGPSGAGKSTLASLIAGLLEPQAGSISLGSQDAATARAGGTAVRALIPQEAYVFNGTLLANVTYLNADATPEQLDDAVAALGAGPLVNRVGGYDAVLDPAALSAGERQLITLVRAYVSHAPVIVLDEATCHMDPASEARAEEAFMQRPGTLVVIAHRMSSALRAKRILLLDGGEATIGTHDELVAQSELYRTLVGHWTGEPAADSAGHPPSSAHVRRRLVQRVLAGLLSLR